MTRSFQNLKLLKIYSVVLTRFDDGGDKSRDLNFMKGKVNIFFFYHYSSFGKEMETKLKIQSQIKFCEI